MCVFRKLRKKIDGIANSQLELTKIIKTQELEKLRQKEKKLDDITYLLKDIKIEVQSCKFYIDQATGEKTVKISYSIPNVILTLDDKGKIIKNNMFYAINMLDLTSIEDTKKVMETLQKFNI